MTTEPPSFQEIMQWSEKQCRDYLEARRWPNGVACPHCGSADPYTITRKSKTKNVVSSFYKCRGCRKQFTVTVGTIFEDSHIPLAKWFATIMLMCASKKGISAHQIHRLLGIQYRSAWYMCHRIREAMREKHPEMFTGTVEADVTFVGGKSTRGGPVFRERVKDEIALGIRNKDGSMKQGKNMVGKPHPRTQKAPVFGMLERGGNVRTMATKINDETAKELQPVLKANLGPGARLITDAHPAYRAIKQYVRHDVVKHELEYVNSENPEIHTQNIEGFWSLLKRSMVGTFHHVNRGYLPLYLNELEFRYDRRTSSDSERFASLMKQVEGRLSWYRKP